MGEAKGKNYLKDNEELMSKYNFEKNKDFDLNKLTCGSHKKIWWRGKCGHEWDELISNMAKGRGCPYCSNHRVLAGFNDLATTHPEIANEWDYEKNGNLKPIDITFGSHKDVWWKCKEGHSYLIDVSRRTRKKDCGCPVCSKRAVLSDYNDLATTDPELAKEWNHEKNGDLNPTDVIASSSKKVWWKCKKGHEWEAIVSSRNSGNGCPFCSGKKVLVGYNDLATTHPEIANEWNYKKNGDLEPTDVSFGSNKKVFWRCKEGHEWLSTVNNRTNGNRGCPYCANKKVWVGYNDLATKNPELAKEWNHEKNGDLNPTDVASNSNKKVWWKCNKGHEWKTSINNRNNGSGCPYCANQKVLVGYNDLATIHPELAKEWDYEKNNGLKPEDFIAGSNKKVWWRCRKEHHSWLASIGKRVRGNGCPKCKNYMKTSFPEQAVYHYVHLYFPDAINGYTDGFNNQMELDIYIPSLHIGIEYDGVAWHNNKASRKREQRKWKICKDNDITLIRIKEFVTEYDNANFSIYRLNTESHDSLNNAILELFDILDVDSMKVDVNADFDKIYSGYMHSLEKTSLEYLYPDIAKEWDYDKNGDLKPAYFSGGSSRKVWWKCSKGHSWKAVISSRTRGNCGCPICSNRVALAGYNDLATTNPELASEWNCKKNGNLKPTEFVAGSRKKVWWKCKEGHEYQAFISDRKSGNGCPYCSGKRVLSGYNDLAFLYPEIAKEWNYKKNGNLKPIDVTAKSNRKVWWRGKCGHEWDAAISNRTDKNYGCPICSNHRVLEKHNDLTTENSELAKEWNYEKNGNLKPIDVTAKSNRKVWWKGKCGHEWLAAICDRTEGCGCPYCANQKVQIGFNDLATLNPDIASEWNYDKNGNLKPTDVTAKSSKKVWWKGKCGHEWDAVISSRTGKSQCGCPFCSNKRLLTGYNDLATTNPEITNEWDNEKNGNLKPTDILTGSNKKVWWKCEKGHSWEASINRRLRPSGCPYCSNKKVLVGYNDLATKCPELVKEWNDEKNGEWKPTEVTVGSNKKAWWKCSNGHEWQAVINSRVNGNGCPYCSNQKVWVGDNDLATTNPEIAKQWNYEKNGDLKPTDVVAGSNKKVWWKCDCGNEWIASVSKRLFGRGCPVCNGGIAKKVKCVETNNVFDSISKAGTSIGLNGSSIQWAIKSGHKCGGYHWKYSE